MELNLCAVVQIHRRGPNDSSIVQVIKTERCFVIWNTGPKQILGFAG
jgi:hypothetical protein